MLPRIDHLVYAAPDLQSGIDTLEEQLGVRAAFGGRHVGFGTHNALLSLGEGTYLEIIAPDPDQPRPPQPRPFNIDALREPRLATWAFAVNGIAEQAASARSGGYDAGQVVPMTRALPDGGELCWKLTRRREAAGDGLVPFLIEWETETHPSATAPDGCILRDLSAEHPHPDEVTRLLSALGIALAITVAGRPALIATIEGPAGTVVLT
ncbi:MAG TPA: VOC family protein [Dehalococcoidia bacterium]|nr:VOC family protein [Dehalococcoidia bacterium]